MGPRAPASRCGPLISWQDQRTVADCARAARRRPTTVRAISGLPLDPMFSATKARWLLDASTGAPDGRAASAPSTPGCCSQLGGGHVIEVGNASRTQLLDVRAARLGAGAARPLRRPARGAARTWSPRPARSRPSRASRRCRTARRCCAVLGDSHAALFAHAGWRPGQVKATYGTGSSVMGLRRPGDADQRPVPDHRLGRRRPGRARLRGQHPLHRRDADLAGRAARDARPASSPSLAADDSRRRPPRPGLRRPRRAVVGRRGGRPDQRADLRHAAAAARARRAGVDRLPGRRQWPRSTRRARRHAARRRRPDRQPHADAAAGRHRAAAPSRARSRPELSALGVAHLAGRVAGLWTQEQLEALDRPRELYEPREAAASRRARVAAWHAAVARARHQEEAAPCRALRPGPSS